MTEARLAILGVLVLLSIPLGALAWLCVLAAASKRRPRRSNLFCGNGPNCPICYPPVLTGEPMTTSTFSPTHKPKR